MKSHLIKKTFVISFTLIQKTLMTIKIELIAYIMDASKVEMAAAGGGKTQ